MIENIFLKPFLSKTKFYFEIHVPAIPLFNCVWYDISPHKDPISECILEYMTILMCVCVYELINERNFSSLCYGVLMKIREKINFRASNRLK